MALLVDSQVQHVMFINMVHECSSRRLSGNHHSTFLENGQNEKVELIIMVHYSKLK